MMAAESRMPRRHGGGAVPFVRGRRVPATDAPSQREAEEDHESGGAQERHRVVHVDRGRQSHQHRAAQRRRGGKRAQSRRAAAAADFVGHQQRQGRQHEPGEPFRGGVAPHRGKRRAASLHRHRLEPVPAGVLVGNAVVPHHLMNVRQMHPHGVRADFTRAGAHKGDRQGHPDRLQRAGLKDADCKAATSGRGAGARASPSRSSATTGRGFTDSCAAGATPARAGQGRGDRQRGHVRRRDRVEDSQQEAERHERGENGRGGDAPGGVPRAGRPRDQLPHSRHRAERPEQAAGSPGPRSRRCARRPAAPRSKRSGSRPARRRPAPAGASPRPSPGRRSPPLAN